MLKFSRFVLLVSLCAVLMPGLAGAADPAPVTPPAAESVPALPPPDADEARLRQQLEQVRSFNAKLRSEREQLQRQVAELEAKVAAENKRLRISPPVGQAPAAAPASSPWTLYGGALAGVLAVIGGAIVWRRRRKGRA